MVAAAVYFPVRGLLPWRENYRRNHKVVELARTILRTTWGAVILAQASTRRIIGGHGRSFAGLVADGIQNSSRRGDRGYEPFSGSGTTLAAAEQTGRLVSAIELAPKYVAVALERMAAMGLSPRQVT